MKLTDTIMIKQKHQGQPTLDTTLPIIFHI